MDAWDDLSRRLLHTLERGERYSQEAFFFVLEALDRFIARLERPRHVSGAELLTAIRTEGAERFGPMARSVFEHWGIKNSLDFGHIVFKMVREGILTRTPQDRLDDFADETFFEKLFDDQNAYRLEETKGKTI